jgi:acyl-CoA synthetase (AMP-forming)/AMP-acid ligase II
MSERTQEMTLVDVLPAGERPALVDPDAGWTLSRDALREVIDDLAVQLASAGARRGEGVAIVQQGAEAVLCFLATVRLGAIAMPLNPALRADDMLEVFADCMPRLMLLDEHGCEAATEAARVADVSVRVVGRGPQASLVDAPPSTMAIPNPDPDDIALLLHTSGTTSRPKAVPLRHRNLAASARAIAAGYGLGDEDVSYCLMPLFHVHGLVASTLAALAGGGAVVVPKRMRPSNLWTHSAAYGVTWFSAVPTILARLPERDDAASDLRFARSCSSSLSPQLWATLESRFGVPVVEAYGMTEASHQMTSNPLPPAERRAGTVGVTAGADVAIVDDQWGFSAHGVAGEVVVRGAGVVDGYLRNPEANAAGFRDGWFRTGDIGRLSSDGYLTLEGRIKEMINRGGEKIAPREIDEALLAHGCVVEAAAYGVPDEKYGEIVHAVVVANEAVDAPELRRHCEEHLAAFKVPRHIHVVTEIPKGPTGKVQRRMLAELLES